MKAKCSKQKGKENGKNSLPSKVEAPVNPSALEKEA
jgi:hypothetical protein